MTFEQVGKDLCTVSEYANALEACVKAPTSPQCLKIIILKIVEILCEKKYLPDDICDIIQIYKDSELVEVIEKLDKAKPLTLLCAIYNLIENREKSEKDAEQIYNEAKNFIRDIVNEINKLLKDVERDAENVYSGSKKEVNTIENTVSSWF